LKQAHGSSLWIATLWGFAAGAAFSQESQPATERLTLREAIAIAAETFTEVQATRAELSAANERVGLARKAYLPDGDVYLQWNRATRNNVFGLVLPGGSVPSISGPALAETTSESSFGSVAAALVRWEAFDFGVRAAGVREAEALRQRAAMGLRVTELDVSFGALDAFLAVVAAESAARAAGATVDRMEVFEEGVSALAENGLRPGADLSLARAELARARTDLIREEQLREEARTRLSEWLGRAGERIEVDGSELVASAPPTDEPAPTDEPREVTSHPLVARQQAELDAARARKDVATKSPLPKIDLLASAYSRGTGALLDGTFEGGSAGLWPERSNWALGVAVRFPFLDLPKSKQETALEEFRARAAEARYENAVQHLEAELERARIRLDAARRIASNTPVELDAARTLQAQARARYEAGLADVLVVAESERILRRAETEDAVARLDVWRARFALAVAEGDLTPALSQLP
jgi:outer membrane protein